MPNFQGIVAALFVILSTCDAYKVLVVFPFPSKSHDILGSGVARLLAEKGHEVTYISPYPVKNPRSNVRYIDVSSNAATSLPANLTAILNKEESFSDMRKFFDATLGVHQSTVTHKNVQDMLNDPNQTFDVVIMDWIINEVLAGFAAVYDCPYIWLSSIEPHSSILSLIDESLNPAYNPGIISTATPPYGFVQRVKELGFLVLNNILKMYYEGIEREIYEKSFGPVVNKRGRNLPPYSEIKYNASLVLGNSHISIGRPTRLPQNYKPVRGFHIDSEAKPLPNDLKKILDDAKNGVIYFSMGSIVTSDSLPEKLKLDFLRVFGELKQTVLWKFEESMQNLPSNVHVLRWAPQQSILAHPNCKLFITHGGGLSTTEAVYYGKPIIGIPVFGDQFTNVGMIANLGMGLKVELSYDIAEDLKSAIEEILNNPRYTTKAQELSFIYHHRPVPPGAELVHWVEHVVRTRGAPHLRSPALYTPFYQKYYLDLAVIIIVAYYALKIFIKRTFRKKTKKLESVRSKKQKKN